MMFRIITVFIFLSCFSYTHCFNLSGVAEGSCTPNNDYPATEEIDDYLYIPKLDERDYLKIAMKPTDQQEFAKKYIYSRFKDDFDFVVLFIDVCEGLRSRVSPGSLNYVQNQVDNIGRGRRYSRASLYGSSSNKLLAIINLRSRLAYKSALLHEISHQWAMYIDPKRRELWRKNGPKSLVDLFDGAHQLYSGAKEVDPIATMPYTKGDLPLGQLGGFREENLSRCDMTTMCANNSILGTYPPERRYRISKGALYYTGGPRAIYNDRELYVMGMIPFEEVLDQWTWVRKTHTIQVHNSLTMQIYTGEGTIEERAPTITRDLWQEYMTTPLENGMSIAKDDRGRVPSFMSAKKNFKALAVLVQSSFAPVSRNTIAEAKKQLRLFSMPASDGTSNTNFWEATGGRGQFHFGDLRASLKN